MKKCPICKVATVLAGIGALNWLLVALFELNLVTAVLGSIPIAVKIVYVLVGLAGLMLIVSVFKNCPACNKG